MRFWFAALSLLLCVEQASAIDCVDLLERAKFWRPSPAKLSKAFKNDEIIALYPRILGHTQATLRAQENPVLTEQAIDNYASIGTGLYASQETIFNYNPMSGVSRRVPIKIARAILKALNIDQRLVGYSRAFTSPNSAKWLFLEGGPLSKWVTLGHQLNGRVTLHRGVEFYELSFYAAQEATVFVLANSYKGFTVFGRKKQKSPCESVYCSKQMKRLLDPEDNRAEVSSGDGTVEFVRELIRLGFAFTGNLPFSNAR